MSEVKNKLTDAPILLRPDFEKLFILQKDFSYSGCGAVLSQKVNDGREHPVAYASRTIRSCEERYSATEGECLTTLWTVDKFRVYLQDRHFELQTDHSALQWIHRNL